MHKSKNFIFPTPLGQVFKIPAFSARKSHSAGLFFLAEYDYFCYLGVHAKFQAPSTPTEL
jgi:hypothetical protein